MIRPTPGRIVWYRPAGPLAGFNVHNADEPLAAIVTYVHSDEVINLTVFDQAGHPHPRTSVKLNQEEGRETEPGEACWMPYQKGQAKAQERAEAERKAGAAIHPGRFENVGRQGVAGAASTGPLAAKDDAGSSNQEDNPTVSSADQGSGTQEPHAPEKPTATNNPAG